MNRRRKKLIMLSATLATIITIVVWDNRKPVFLETAKGHYEVLSTRYVHGTNLTFSADIPGAAWSRRQLDRIGIHLKAPRDVTGSFKGDGVHAIVVQCKACVPDEDLNQLDVECETVQGQTGSAFDGIVLHGPNSRVCFVFFYADIDASITNFCAKELRIFRKSDHHELTRLTLPR